MSQIPLLVAFGGGLASFLSPCVLPLVPVYLASLAGPGIFDRVNRRSFPVFIHALSFVIGFTIVFTLMGAGAGLAGAILISHLEIVQQVAGWLLIFFGALMLLSLRITWLNLEKRITAAPAKATGYLRSFLTGAVFTLAWTPCVGPILTSILAIASGSGTVLQGSYLLAVYSLGLALPFLLMGIAFDFFSPYLKAINRYSRLIYVIAGALLALVGILILTNKLIWFSTLV